MSKIEDETRKWIRVNFIMRLLGIFLGILTMAQLSITNFNPILSLTGLFSISLLIGASVAPLVQDYLDLVY